MMSTECMVPLKQNDVVSAQHTTVHIGPGGSETRWQSGLRGIV